MEIILFIQSYSHPWLDQFFYYITNMGSQMFYLALVPFIYWFIDKKTGFRLALLMSVSAMANLYLKLFFYTSRPTAEQVRVLHAETAEGYAFPSFHAQSSATLLGYLASKVRRSWFTVVCIVLILLVSLSRLYLGVHFPIDILGGLGLAIILLLIFILLVEPLFFMVEFSLPTNLFLSLALPPLFLFLSRVPDAYRLVGILAGVCAGYALERSLINFDAHTSFFLNLLKLLLGYGVLGAGYFYLDLLPSDPLYLQSIAYGVLALWVTFLAPALFRFLRLEK